MIEKYSSAISAANCGTDFYCDFRAEFSPEKNKKVFVEISADSTFVLYINGLRVKASQLADMPSDRTFTRIEITGLLSSGKNAAAVELHHVGEDFLTVRDAPAFIRVVIFDEDDQILAATPDGWKCRKSLEYTSGLCCKVSFQLGFVYACDTTRDDGWRLAGYDDSAWETPVVLNEESSISERKVPLLLERPEPSVILSAQGVFQRNADEPSFADQVQHDWLSARYPAELFQNFKPDHPDGYYRLRPVLPRSEKLTFLPLVSFPGASGYYVILDLGCETVGWPTFRIHAPAGTELLFAAGEHLNDGRVRASVGGRHFTDFIRCREGETDFVYAHRRVTGRYIELHIKPGNTGTVTLDYAGLIPLELPLPPMASFSCGERLLEKIRSVSMETLRNSMHEHYEDCPWREQALYPYDSRNQMLYGYSLWGNYAFAAASLDLLGKNFDGKRYLGLTSPGARKSGTIPVFTFVWITALYENALYSGSLDLLKRWKDQADLILKNALAEPDPYAPGLYHPGTGKNVWNFCEWNGKLGGLDSSPQAPYNIYLCEALRSCAKIHRLLGESGDFFDGKASELGTVIEKVFWDTKRKLYGEVLPEKCSHEAFEHIQAIMLAGGLVPEAKQKQLLALFQNGSLRGIDFSAMRYLVNGLLDKGPEARAYLFRYLRNLFEPVVLSGSSTLWETRQGADDFDSAGSLCHGWSAVMPYYLSTAVLGVTPLEPGFRKFSVKPYTAYLNFADGEVPTPFGKIRISWKKHPDGAADLKICYPEGTEPLVEEYPECPLRTLQKEVAR